MDNPFQIINERLSNIETHLNALLQEKEAPKQVQEDEIGGVELAERVTKLKKSTIYYLTHKRQIPYFKKGRKLYFSRNDLEDWIKEDGVKTEKEIVRGIDNLFPRQKMR